MKIVNIATCKRRAKHLQATIDSIKGVDQINVLANDYKPNVTGANVIEMVQDFGARSKFFLQSNFKDCYYFTCDDDLIYHKDYFNYLVERIEEKERKCVVGVHGSIYKFWPIENYYWSQDVLHFSNQLKSDKFVNLIGTGTLCFHSSLFENVDLFNSIPVNNGIDPHFAKICIDNNIPMLSVNRPSNFVIEQGGSQECSIWHDAAKECSELTEVVNSIGHKLTKIKKC